MVGFLSCQVQKGGRFERWELAGQFSSEFWASIVPGTGTKGNKHVEFVKECLIGEKSGSGTP
jgi:hypothetical protein